MPGAGARFFGQDFAEAGLLDEHIIPLFHKMGNITFITRDRGFYKPSFAHEKYCLIVLGTGQNEVATYLRKLLNHPEFNTNKKRMGKIIYNSYTRIHYYTINDHEEKELIW